MWMFLVSLDINIIKGRCVREKEEGKEGGNKRETERREKDREKREKERENKYTDLLPFFSPVKKYYFYCEH